MNIFKAEQELIRHRERLNSLTSTLSSPEFQKLPTVLKVAMRAECNRLRYLVSNLEDLLKESQ